MKIHIISTRGVKAELLTKIHDILAGFSGPFQFQIHNTGYRVSEEVVSWETLFDFCAQFRSSKTIPDDEFVVLLTDKQNENNWFSAPTSDGERSFFIQTTGWEYYISCDPVYPIAYEVLENILQVLAFPNLEDGIPYFHEPAIGCMFDMCGWKSDITFKLRTADICESCIEMMQEKGLSLEMICQTLEILEDLRKEMLASRKLRRERAEDTYLPFPVAITRRKMNNTMEPFRKFLMMIDHFDSLVRTSVFLMGSVMLGEEFPEFCSSAKLDERPSLGDWVQALRKLGRKEGQQAAVIEISNDLLKRLVDVANIAVQDKIVTIRNTMRGHGYIEIGDTQYRQAFEEHLPTIQRIETILRPLFVHYPLYLTDSINRVRGNTFRVRVKPLMGSHPDFLDDKMDLSNPAPTEFPLNNKISAYSAADKKWYCLHPYLLYVTCPECNHHRILVKDGELYIDPYIGHRVKISTIEEVDW